MLLDFINQDATTQKDIIEESINLVREGPVSSTSSGGTDGVHYDVVDWPETLVSGVIYFTRLHTSNIGAYSIEGVDVKRPDGTDPQPLDAPVNTVMGYRYDGTNLIQTFLPRYPLFQASPIPSSNYTKIASIRLTAMNDNVEIKLDFWEDTDSALEDHNGDLTILAIQTAAMGNDPNCRMVVANLRQASTIDILHTDFKAYFSSVTATESVIDIYMGAQNNSARFKLQPRYIRTTGGGVTFYSSQATDTEANITGGTFDVTSEAAAGEVVYNQALDPGGDINTGNGWFTVIKTSASTYLCTYTALDAWTHDLLSSGGTGAIIPAAYRPNNTIGKTYQTDGNLVRSITISTNGSIGFLYRDWSGTSTASTTMQVAFSETWVAGGS